MSKCCGNRNAEVKNADPCAPPEPACGGAGDKAKDTNCPFAWFGNMVEHCHAYATAEKEKGTKIVGICCEYTPRELIMAAGAVPVCLCGGDADMIPAAEEQLPATLCPLVKSTFGYSVQEANPFLEMADLLVAETTCDGKKKMYELLAQARPMYVLELPQKPDDPDALQHWVLELEKLKDHLQEQFRTKISTVKIREAIKTMNRERALRRRLAELMKSAEPPLTGRELLDMKSIISCMPADFEQYRKAIDGLPGRQIDPPASSRTRVLLTGVPLAHGAERVMDIIEQHGGLVVCQENCTGLKPLLEDVEPDAQDPIHALAEKYFHLPCSVMTKNDRRLESIATLARDYNAHCIIELIWQACLTYDVESHFVRQFAERELGIPYLRIETDYSPSDSARIAMRVEALFETIRGKGD
ncbi:MAG: 2-hydroxyacyl-CoA dehydratase [Kiritimatiellae bacterium]|nr:2-hydroxyacyl-CoA dehydratase [Kiritimatiellia bacterium]